MTLVSDKIDLKEQKVTPVIQPTKYGLWIGPHYNSRGGVCSFIKTYYNEGLFENRTVRFIATVKDGSKLNKLYTFLKAFALVVKDIRQLHFIHVHLSSDASFWRKSIFILFANSFKVPVLIHLHASGFVNFFNNSGKIKKSYIRYNFRKADQVFVLSREMEFFIHSLSLHTKPVIFPNPIKLHPITHPVPNQANRLLFLGRIIPEKGISELLKAVKVVSRQVPEIKLIIGGDGNMDLLHHLIEEYQVKAHVELKGWLNDKECQALMQHCTLLILPSYNEGQSMTILDAMQSSLPVITTSVGGNTYIIDHMVTGVLVPPRDATALANAILQTLDDSALRERIVIAAKQKIEAVFDSKKVVAQMLQNYTCYQGAEKNVLN